MAYKLDSDLSVGEGEVNPSPSKTAITVRTIKSSESSEALKRAVLKLANVTVQAVCIWNYSGTIAALATLITDENLSAALLVANEIKPGFVTLLQALTHMIMSVQKALQGVKVQTDEQDQDTNKSHSGEKIKKSYTLVVSRIVIAETGQEKFVAKLAEKNGTSFTFDKEGTSLHDSGLTSPSQLSRIKCDTTASYQGPLSPAKTKVSVLTSSTESSRQSVISCITIESYEQVSSYVNDDQYDDLMTTVESVEETIILSDDDSSFLIV